MRGLKLICGSLGADPEMRYCTASGTPVTSFSVATHRSYTDQSGERQIVTTWYRVSARERQAENANQFLTKGQKVMVVGEMKEPNAYQNRNGEWTASLEMRAHRVVFLTSRNEAAGGGYAGNQNSNPAGGEPPVEAEEDIPF